MFRFHFLETNVTRHVLLYIYGVFYSTSASFILIFHKFSNISISSNSYSQVRYWGELSIITENHYTKSPEINAWSQQINLVGYWDIVYF